MKMTENMKIPQGLHEALELVRPVLRKDGGDIELVEWTPEGRARVRLTGRCQGCPKAGRTLKNIVERTLLKLVPEVRGVEHVGSDNSKPDKDSCA